MSDEPVRYRFYGVQPFFFLVVLGIITLVGTPTAIIGMTQNDSGGAAFLLLWLGILVWMWFNLLARVAYEILLWPSTGRLQMRAVLRTKETRLAEITSIGASAGGLDNMTVTVRYAGGSGKVLRTLDGMSDLVRRIQEANPVVQVRGL